MKKLIYLLGLIMLVGGCASMNPFYQFYQDRTGGMDLSRSPNVILPAGEPQIFSGSIIVSRIQMETEYKSEIQKIRISHLEHPGTRGYSIRDIRQIT